MLFLSPGKVYWLQTLLHWCHNNTVFIVDVSRVYASGVGRKFSWGFFIQWQMVVICIWCALFVTSYSSFQTNVLAKFVYITGKIFYTHSPDFVSLHWI